MIFDVQITDLYGTVLATVTQYTGLEVTAPISDDRSGKVEISHYDPAVADLVFTAHGHRIGALGRMVRVKYRGTTVLWGLVTAPKFSSERAKVTVNLIGPSFKLRHRQINYSDWFVTSDKGDVVHMPNDWTTIREIVEAAYDNDDQAAINVPDIGITVVNVSGDTADPGSWTQLERGANNWDKITEIFNGPFAGEFDVVPYDPAAGETPFTSTPVTVDAGAYTFPTSTIGPGQTPTTVPIQGGGLALPAAGRLKADIVDGTKLHRRYTLAYTGRTANTLTGVTGYPSKGHFNGGEHLTTIGGSKPYHYADLQVHDFIGSNRTGVDLADGDDPYTGAQLLSLVYDDTDADASNLADFEWEPDGATCHNQQVALVSANTRTKREVKQIARNINSWLEIGVYSAWQSVGGSNTNDMGASTLAAYAANEVEKYGRAPNFFTATLMLEPASGAAAYGSPDWQPQWLRDFGLGDRVNARMRQGYVDSGDIVARIMQVKLTQADANNNVKVDIECSPHATDLSEISVVA